MITLSTRARVWAAAVDGERIDTGLPSTPECVDLARDWAMQLGAPEIAYGHGKDFARNLAKQPGWEFIGPDQPALPGDVVSWDLGDAYGHVAVVQADEGDTLEVTQQNPLPAHTKKGATKRRIVGYARPILALETLAATRDTGTVTVAKGDTYWGISQRLGVTVADLRRLNPGVDENRLEVGQTIKTGGAAPALYIVPGAYTLARETPAGEVVGQLPKGTQVTGTGKRDGVWIQAASPYQAAHGAPKWYHQDFLKEIA